MHKLLNWNINSCVYTALVIRKMFLRVFTSTSKYNCSLVLKFSSNMYKLLTLGNCCFRCKHFFCSVAVWITFHWLLKNFIVYFYKPRYNVFAKYYYTYCLSDTLFRMTLSFKINSFLLGAKQHLHNTFVCCQIIAVILIVK